MAKDFPFKEICEAVDVHAKSGALCFQKWTCDGCGKRLTASTPNYFTFAGHCEECNAITDIEKKGCNYLLIMTVGGEQDDTSAEN